VVREEVPKPDEALSDLETKKYKRILSIRLIGSSSSRRRDQKQLNPRPFL
jgi:hypothetical protein